MIASPRSRRWVVALLSAMVVLYAPFGATAVKPKQVLLLHSFGREFAPYNVIAAAFRSELAKDSGEPIAVYDATMDAGQASGSDVQEPLLELLRLAAGRGGHHGPAGCRLLSPESGQGVSGDAVGHYRSGRAIRAQIGTARRRRGGRLSPEPARSGR